MNKIINDINNYISTPPKNYEIQHIHKTFNIRNFYNKFQNNSQNLYHFYYNIDNIPTCICGKSLKFISFNKGYTKYCSSRCQMSDTSFKNKMKEYYYYKYGVENPSQSEIVQEKIKKTNLEKYGVENFLSLNNIQKQIKQTKLEKYGNENYNNIEKIKQTNLEKYGVSWISQNKEILKKQQQTKKNNHNTIWYNKIISKYDKVKPLFNIDKYKGVDYNNKYEWQCIICNTEFEDDLYAGRAPRCPKCFPKIGGNSKKEKEIVEYIKSLKIQIIENSRKIIPPYEVDIYLPEHQLAIEYNGLYYHSIEKIQDKYYHQNKVKLAQENNIRLLHIWEHEWEDDKILIQNIIQYYINNLNEEIYPQEPKLYNINNNLIWI
jgi:hypothetical protein